jgi:GT2 family glycosyltransferase
LISIIICSRTPEIDDALKANIENTIGELYEIILIDNSENKYNIFEAYNLGVAKSKGSILCFMHDDIQFHTKDWGIKVKAYFEEQRIGAIGIAGTPYAAKMPGSWWGGGLINQQLCSKEGSQIRVNTQTLNDKEEKKEVVLLDGIWLCIKRELFEKIKFDEKKFTGFHFYDIDICLQVHSLNFKLYCVFDILIEHFSNGNVNQEWINNALILKKKWNFLLPISTVVLADKEKAKIEFKTLQEFIQILIVNNHNDRSSYYLALKQLFSHTNGISWNYRLDKILYFITKYIKSIILLK